MGFAPKNVSSGIIGIALESRVIRGITEAPLSLKLQTETVVSRRTCILTIKKSKVPAIKRV